MATVRTWISTDGNWAAAGSWSPSGVPITGDTVILAGSSTASVTSGFAQGAIDLLLLYVDDSYLGNIGTSGTPLVIGATTIKHFGRGTFYLQDDTGTPATGSKIYVESGNNSNAMILTVTGTVDMLTVSRGTVTISSGGPARLRVGALARGNRACRVTVGASGGAGYVFVYNGTLTTNIGCSGGILYDGIWIHSAGEILDWKQFGGTMYFDAGTLTPGVDAAIFGGTFNASRGNGIRTFGTTSGRLVVYPKAEPGYRVNYSLATNWAANEIRLAEAFAHSQRP